MMCVNNVSGISNTGYNSNVKKSNDLNFFRQTASNDTFELQSKPKDDKKNAIIEKTQNLLKFVLSFITGFKPSENMTGNIHSELADCMIEAYKKTDEGKLRSQMTDKEIETSATRIFNKSIERLNIPKEISPKLIIAKNPNTNDLGGLYTSGIHSIVVNPKTYRDGLMEFENIIMHEATHCKEALIRTGIPQKRVDEIVQEELLSKINNGESEKIELRVFDHDSPVMTTSVNIPDTMKNDFINFAKENLYTKSQELKDILNEYCDNKTDISVLSNKNKQFASIINKLNSIISNHPEFSSQYCNEKEALTSLLEYSIAHNTRYNLYTDTTVNSLDGREIKIDNLTGEELKYAEKSLVNIIKTHEATASVLYGGDTSRESLIQYLFSPEEVLAETNGLNFLIEKYQSDIETKKTNNTLSENDEIYLNALIQETKNSIEIRNKGLEYNERLQQNPDDEEAKNMVDELIAEMTGIQRTIITDKDELPEWARKIFLEAENQGAV